MQSLRDIAIDSEKLRDIVDDVKRLSDKTWEEFCDEARINDFTIKGFIAGSRKSNLSSAEVKQLCDYIERLADDPIRAFLLNKYRSEIGGALRYRNPVSALNVMGDALVSWLGLTPQHHSVVNSACAGPRGGRFLLMRRDGDGSLVSSLMSVSPASRKKPTATFITYSPQIRKGAHGVLIEFEGRIHTYGLANHPFGVRTTTMVAKARGDGPVDLQGIRLGLVNESGGAFAHRIYAYHLPPRRMDKPISSQVRPLLGRLAASRVDEMAEIVEDFPKVYKFLGGKSLKLG